MEGFSTLSLDDMCLLSDLVTFLRFKVPNFVKYKGDSCSRHHLMMFYQKMASHTHDNKLMIHYFQYSLSGASLNWYMKFRKEPYSVMDGPSQRLFEAV